MLLGIFISSLTHASDIADAAMVGDFEQVDVLISQGIDVNEPQVDGNTALHWAARFDDLDMASRLMTAGADVAAVNRVLAPPMLLAAINGSAEMIKLFLDHGADPNAAP